MTTLQSVAVQLSAVAFSECTLQSNGSRAFAASDVTFADGSMSSATFFGAGGIELDGGTLTITGDASTSVSVIVSPLSSPLSAIGVLSGTLTIAPTVTLNPGLGAAAINNLAGSVITRAVPALRAAVTAQQLDAQLFAPGASDAFLLAGFPISPPAPVGLLGTLWLDPILLLIIGSGPVSGAGAQTLSIALPPVPAGLTLSLQSIAVTPIGLRLSSPVTLTLDG